MSEHPGIIDEEAPPVGEGGPPERVTDAEEPAARAEESEEAAEPEETAEPEEAAESEEPASDDTESDDTESDDTPSDHTTAARQALAAVRAEVGKAVVGQDAAVTGLVIALLCRGHVLVEGVPGVAKTLLVRTLAAALRLDFARVQFTPDLMPGDVTGSLVYDTRTAEFSFREGPVFTQLLLADEINRTPPKTQASLLEAMEERQVTVDGRPRLLPEPFVVIATQNPVEYEGTYPLPEAQLDRFLLKLRMPVPGRDGELEVLGRHAAGFDPRDLAAAGVRAVAGPDELATATSAVREVAVSPAVLGYIVDLVRATRAAPSVALGVSPRGATALLATSRAWAWLSGREYVTPDDVKALARPALRHRLQLRPEAELEGVTVDAVLETVLATVPVPR
jgi:MoxR-like ATPase